MLDQDSALLSAGVPTAQDGASSGAGVFVRSLTVVGVERYMHLITDAGLSQDVLLRHQDTLVAEVLRGDILPVIDVWFVSPNFDIHDNKSLLSESSLFLHFRLCGNAMRLSTGLRRMGPKEVYVLVKTPTPDCQVVENKSCCHEIVFGGNPRLGATAPVLSPERIVNKGLRMSHVT